MLSTRGTKTVRLQRKKSGLDFSVKGGREHGIPVVVSWIKEGGVACKNLQSQARNNESYAMCKGWGWVVRIL